MLSIWTQNNITLPLPKFYGVNGHWVTQGNYWNRANIPFDYQVQQMVNMGFTWARVDLQPQADGSLSQTGPNWHWGRLLGTSPTDIGFPIDSTDARSNNYGIYNKCQAAGITMLPMLSVIAGSSADWWAIYTTPEDAYNAGFAQGAGFTTEHGDLFTHVELGNELELFTGLITGGVGSNINDYDPIRLPKAVQYIAGMEAGVKSVKPTMITMFDIAGWLASVLMDQVLAAAPTIDIVAWHWYSEHQSRLKSGVTSSKLPFDGKTPAPNTFVNIFSYLANRYPSKKVWFTEAGYRWSAGKTQFNNETDQVNNYESIVNDFKRSSNGEAIFYHELVDMIDQGEFSREKHYGLIGSPDYETTGVFVPVVKELGKYIPHINSI